MAFSIARQQQNGFDTIELKDSTGTRVAVIPGLGASLHVFEVGGLNVIDNYPDINAFRAEVNDSFKSVKLSPFACRINDSAYTWEQKKHTIAKSSIHGLLYDVAFEVTDESADEEAASITLAHQYKGADPGYPFAYTCNVQYRLLPGNMLEVITTVINQDEHTIPVMDGWHPYFSTGTPVDRLELQFSSKEIVEFDERLLPTGKLLPYTTFAQPKSMAGVELDNSFLLDFTQPSPLCTLRDPEKGISIEFYPDPHYPVLQVYTPPHRGSVAIENLSGAPDAFNNGIGLVQLEAGQSARFTTTIRVKQDQA
ncbi:aldose 1-epimerase [Chitinophaga cymbidii]|uniref:Aldose epimerase n=1 Tax=Chitinophaga cymbidii TaxID=1096750 RepID=A0A512RLA8_9BACT|nr:aldose 1-epimerase [Chitinophaga cymbidii]GEP96495.1 aldose epimerase [Chitinophaga cymbidii]